MPVWSCVDDLRQSQIPISSPGLAQTPSPRDRDAAGGGKVALTAWERRGTPSRALWEATNRICSRFLGSVLLLLDCAEVSLFLCLYGNDVCDCVRQPDLCDSRLLRKGKGIWHHGKEPRRKLILQDIWQC